jgi:antitoxin (DNA-binding transcriptional repressor) of toxin-antitoxin stability system
MEKSLGIEAARARLGDIADHARTTGQVTALTRHGRTVAVIGPAHAVQPAGSVKVTLWLGDDDQVCVLPALPRMGETFLVETATGDEDHWLVTNIQWDLRPGEEPVVNVLCDLADGYSAWVAANRPAPNDE